ncbi:prepilin peptidase [Planctomycetota bacterium]
MMPDWIWLVFIFVFGCCIGSFLNVVIYRMPREKSVIRPPSACPACGTHIQFYDNIPLISWILLGRKCRYCKERISPRYFVIELLTGILFAGLFFLYFRLGVRTGIGPFLEGGWVVYLIHIILLAGFLAASAIDLELWVIPISICWFVTIVGLVGSAVAGYIIDPLIIRGNMLLPSTTTILCSEVMVASLAGGAVAGLAISFSMLATGLIKGSYESEGEDSLQKDEESEQSNFNHRREMCREIVYLLPIIICCVISVLLAKYVEPIGQWWLNFSQHPVVSGLMGSLFGYFVGCAVVWATRILGTLGFGKEAMGLGDMHLMGAAGAVIGPFFVFLAFFIAPFFGLAWAGTQMFFKKTRQIPYGPFLSLGIFTVMMLHDWIFSYVTFLFYR